MPARLYVLMKYHSAKGKKGGPCWPPGIQQDFEVISQRHWWLTHMCKHVSTFGNAL